MDRIANLKMLVGKLLAEDNRYSDIKIPDDLDNLQKTLRALMNVRMPRPLSQEVQKMQDDELQSQLNDKGVVTLSEIPVSPVDSRLRLWQGDITRLQIDAIVNAANSRMLGCFVPLHKCIDNAIHSAAGMELREECSRIMNEQAHDEPTGKAKITRGYNLPAKYVIHTVGPIVYGAYPTEKDCHLLADSYRNSLKLADENGLHSIAFCCISTGEFRFPQEKAAEIAVATVEEFFKAYPDSSIDTVVFNVFKDSDLKIYMHLLGYD